MGSNCKPKFSLRIKKIEFIVKKNAKECKFLLFSEVFRCQSPRQYAVLRVKTLEILWAAIARQNFLALIKKIEKNAKKRKFLRFFDVFRL